MVGDYKHPPPPGIYEGLHRAAKASQTQPTVTLTRSQRRLVAAALWERFVSLGSTLAVIAVAGRHVHLLLKMPSRLARHWIGCAKRHVTFTLRDDGWNQTPWAGGAKIVPIRDRAHQLNVYRYIEDHASEGAYVLRHKDRAG